MKKILIFFSFFFYFSTNVYTQEFKLEKVIGGLDEPWSLSFIDTENLLFTEKPGKLYSLNLKNKKISEIKHDLEVLEYGQGGLLDVLFKDQDVYISYSENRGDRTTSTSVAKGKLNPNSIKFKNIFRSEPPIDSQYHFGSRLVIKDNYIFVTAGERGQGMIAQDPTKHPGSIIRINLDGSIPKDNPKFKNKKDWLPEIFQIGVRNPQGMSLSPFDNKVYLSNHGAKGGDWFGVANYGENYGWKILGWGGTNYNGTKIGPKWKPGFTKAIKYWVPSIAVSAMTIYKGEEFKEWNGDALITSLKDKSLRKIKFKDNNFINEKIIFKGKIGRIRDIKIHKETGELYMLSDKGELWRMYK
ncbi:PQQ-dependent sugar dehydrogenase [Pelagibacteraceae bacterium]|nr:PQQ-dependent sugar dehydrogenase [Pelagibacteraceae bacterium]